MSKTFFISDLHFGHNNVIRYENRPYANTEEMDADLIKKWNSVVSRDDTVWFLGDLTLTSSKERIANILRQLKGHIKMIKGNHDARPNSFYLENGVEFISRNPVILKGHFILSHEPMPQMYENNSFYYIYGHVHGSPAFATETPNSRCVCCERQNFTPIELEVFNKYDPSTNDWLNNRHGQE